MSSTRILLLSPGGIGGVNTQVRLLSKALTSRNHETSMFLTTKHSGKNFLWILIRIPLFVIRLLKFKPNVCYIPLASRGSFYRKLIFAKIAKFLRIPYILHIHGGGFSDFYEELGMVQKRSVRWLFCSSAHIFILHSGQIDLCERVTAGSVKPKIAILRNGIEVQGQGQSYKLPAEVDSIDLIFIGDVTYRKGVDTLMQLNSYFRKNNIRVKIVGKVHADVKAALEIKSSQDLTQLDFLGPLTHSSAMMLLSKSHMLVLPSRVENFPNVILEAFNLGVPVLASRVGAIPELISHGNTGWLIPLHEEDETALMLGMDLALAEKSRWPEFSERARLDATSRFDILKVADELFRVADCLLNE